jgi:hypothetical protein
VTVIFLCKYSINFKPGYATRSDTGGSHMSLRHQYGITENYNDI